MTYLIIADWDEDLHPTQIDHRDTLEEANECVANIVAKKGLAQTFTVDTPHAHKDVAFIVVDSVNKTVTFDDVSEQAHIISRAWDALRQDRNTKLDETDWYAFSDVTMPSNMKTYRQALRDLPANTSDPTDVTWPTKPS